jgi:hypothetical protein
VGEQSQHLTKLVSIYRENDDLGVFEYNKAVQKGNKKEENFNEFKDLWVLKTYIFTDCNFPAVRRRAEVVHSHELMISPIDTAITSIADKNADLRDKVNNVEMAPAGPWTWARSP